MSDTAQDSQPTQSQAIVARKRPYKPRKGIAVQSKVISLAAQGATNSEISRTCEIDRATVQRILSATEIQQHVNQVRSDLVLGGDLWKARKVMREKLEKGSESAATSILKGFNVLQTRPEVSVNVNLAQNWLVIKEAEQGE